MGLIALKLAGLVGLLLPMTVACATFLRRKRPGMPASEALLAGLTLTPVLLIVEVVALGSLPAGRPLDALGIVQGLLSLGGLTLMVVWWRDFFAFCRDLACGLGRVIRSAWLGPLVVLVLGVAGFTAAAIVGFWASPCAWDELGYHVPQAVQPYQDGFLGPVQSDAVWADSYPRGVELLWYWTLQLTHTDAGFHPVNATLGFVFILAAYVAGRRMQLDAGLAAMCAGLVPTAPVAMLLAAIGYIDLSVAGTSAAMVAFALPERDRGWSWASAVPCAAGAALTLWMKFLPIVAVCLTFAYVFVRAVVGWWRRSVPGAPRSRPGAFQWCLVATVALALASVPYVRTYLTWGSPTYPMELKLGGHTVFKGPMKAPALEKMTDRSVAERNVTNWLDWGEPLTTDSPGGFGMVFAMALILAALVLPVTLVYRFDLHWAYLAVLSWSVLALPSFNHPRYALLILLPAVLSLGRLLAELSPGAMRKALPWALVGLTACGQYHCLRPMRNQSRWQLSLADSADSSERTRRSVEDYAIHGVGLDGPSRRRLYALMPPGGTLISAIYDFHGLLYDRHYSYRVEFRPARPWPYPHYPLSELTYGAENAAEWLAGLRADNVACVLTYGGSTEDTTLAAPDSGYHLEFEYTEPENRYTVRVYRATGSKQ
ncbi:MAG: hypothetical protein PVJ57_13080 [Phycisphaerae bacterium]|jgi:hypothetical protein